MFKVGDVIQHPAGGAYFRIVLVDEAQNAYKVLRLDNHQITLIGIDKGYILVEDPPEETYYTTGQVLLKKEGPPRIGLVCKTTPGGDADHHTYLVVIYTNKGELVQAQVLTQREIKKEFEISNFKWVVMYGDPRKIVRKALTAQIGKYKKQLEEHEALLESLTYYDKILEEEGNS